MVLQSMLPASSARRQRDSRIRYGLQEESWVDTPTGGHVRFTGRVNGMVSIDGNRMTVKRMVRVLLCGAALWLISSLSVKRSLRVFLLGALLSWLVWALTRKRRPRVLSTAQRLLLSAAGTVALLEISLRLAPGLLSGKIANFTYGAYHTDPGGMHEHHEQLGHTMKRRFRKRIYWNGHWWRHETNANGYRGPLLKKADVVFLGDSMVYGHGVETDETAAAQFETLTGLRTANLGVQAFGAIQELILMEQLGMTLHPRYVVLCIHPNDLIDSSNCYSEEELRKFIATPSDEPIHIFSGHRKSRSLSQRAERGWAHRIAAPLRASRALKALKESLSEPASRQENRKISTDLPAGLFVPQPADIRQPFAPTAGEAPALLKLQWRAHCRALERLQARCDDIRATLIVFDLGYSTAFCEATEELANAIGARYSPAGRRVLQQAIDGHAVYLADDGHWSPQGNLLIARQLAKEVEQR